MHRINDIQYLESILRFGNIGENLDGEKRKNSKTNFSNIYLNAVLH